MENKDFKKLLKFHGDHNTLVSLRIINNLLKLVTLGLYYPWARTSILKYMYGESEFQGTRFVWHGTGKEIFRGFIKAIILFGGIYVFFIFCAMSQNMVLMIVGFLVFFVGFMLIIPLAIHGSNRYRLSRSSWRGIHFGYRGNLGQLYKVFLTNMLLTIVTGGLYGAWFKVELKKYVYGHMRFGNVEFKFTGKGLDLFIIQFKGIVFGILTLGIYFFWYIKNLVQFEVSNIKVTQDGREINARTSITPGQIFGMFFSNYFIIIFTLGIGTGIAINRIMRVVFENIEFDDAIDPDRLEQTELEYKDASGDDLAGMLDLSIV